MKVLTSLLVVIGASGAFSLNVFRYNLDTSPTTEKGPIKEGDVEFHFYSRDNPLRPIVLPHIAANWEIPEHFRPGEELIVIIHGFTGSANATSVVYIRDAVLYSKSANVIVVHWGNLAQGPWYDEASSNVARVAPLLADGIRHLDQRARQAGAANLIQERTHIIGFSLGSQVAGLTGSHLNGEVARITGLDPAKPIFDQLGNEARLDKTDARFVVVIHTAAGFLAFEEPTGDADFYPNGGMEQPGCVDSPASALVCNHFRAYEYFVESIYEPRAFPAVQCDSWEEFKQNRCVNNSGKTVYMGFTTDNTTSGRFYLRTNSEKPFGLGESKYVGTTTTTTTTTTETSSIDYVKKKYDEKGPKYRVIEVDNNLIDSDNKSHAVSVYSSPIMFLIVLTIHKLLST